MTNVEALTLALFQSSSQQPNTQITFEQLRETGWHQAAKRLAEQGVLVVTNLTPEELGALWMTGTRYEAGEDNVDYAKPDIEGLKESLLAIARGEA